MTILGRLPEDQAQQFIVDNPLAYLSSKSADGTRRICTNATGPEFESVVRAFILLPDSVVTLSKNKHKVVHTKPVKVSNVGTSFRGLWEKIIGYRISCSTCIEYLYVLDNYTNHNHDKLVSEMYSKLPFPDTMRRGKTATERKQIISEVLEQLVPKKKSSTSDTLTFNDRDWSVVVTTAPRQKPTLEQCLSSIKVAGWKPIVFAEPDSVILNGYNYLHNQVRLGAWHNWLRSARWALEKTTAKYILSVQDDSLFHPDSRLVIEKVMWPTETTAFISLYTASHYSADKSGNTKPIGINNIKTSSFWGACALVFPREALRAIIDHPLTATWTGIAPTNLSDKEKLLLLEKKKLEPWRIQNVDTAIGRIVNSLHLEMYVVDPSPVKHIAKFSSIGHGSDTGKRNCSRCADHNTPLLQQVFPK
jgi:hypothetical protein